MMRSSENVMEDIKTIAQASTTELYLAYMQAFVDMLGTDGFWAWIYKSLKRATWMSDLGLPLVYPSRRSSNNVPVVLPLALVAKSLHVDDVMACKLLRAAMKMSVSASHPTFATAAVLHGTWQLAQKGLMAKEGFNARLWKTCCEVAMILARALPLHLLKPILEVATRLPLWSHHPNLLLYLVASRGVHERVLSIQDFVDLTMIHYASMPLPVLALEALVYKDDVGFFHISQELNNPEFAASCIIPNDEWQLSLKEHIKQAPSDLANLAKTAAVIWSVDRMMCQPNDAMPIIQRTAAEYGLEMPRDTAQWVLMLDASETYSKALQRLVTHYGRLGPLAQALAKSLHGPSEHVEELGAYLWRMLRTALNEHCIDISGLKHVMHLAATMLAQTHERDSVWGEIYQLANVACRWGAMCEKLYSHTWERIIDRVGRQRFMQMLISPKLLTKTLLDNMLRALLGDAVLPVPSSERIAQLSHALRDADIVPGLLNYRAQDELRFAQTHYPFFVELSASPRTAP